MGGDTSTKRKFDRSLGIALLRPKTTYSTQHTAHFQQIDVMNGDMTPTGNDSNGLLLLSCAFDVFWPIADLSHVIPRETIITGLMNGNPMYASG